MFENPNAKQVGGDHYKVGGEEHWDRVARLGLDYFQAQITKYVERCWKKNGVQDLEKALHFLEKYIAVKQFEAEADTVAGDDDGSRPGQGYVDQDRP